uniref:Gag-pol polyprotein n=1 Tax=Solanum tuberosum TaxID=4113 RepID=M1D9Z3_SOLTU
MVVKECHTAMHIHDMDISRLMVHAQHIEEEKVKKRSREAKRAKTGDGYFSHLRSDGHGRSRFRQRFFGQGSSNAPSKFNKNRVSNPKPQGGNGSWSLLPNCARCGMKHEGKCLADTDGCFGCGKSGHKIRDFPMLTAEGTEGKQAPHSGSGSNAPKQNRIYALQTRGEQEGSSDVVTDMLKVFELDVYALLDLGATLSFVTPYVAMRSRTMTWTNGPSLGPRSVKEVRGSWPQISVSEADDGYAGRTAVGPSRRSKVGNYC